MIFIDTLSKHSVQHPIQHFTDSITLGPVTRCSNVSSPPKLTKLMVKLRFRTQVPGRSKARGKDYFKNTLSTNAFATVLAGLFRNEMQIENLLNKQMADRIYTLLAGNGPNKSTANFSTGNPE